jgi:hypothetical protein
MAPFNDESKQQGVDPRHSPSNMQMKSSDRLSKDAAYAETDTLKAGEFLPNPEETIEALGIPDWKAVEKQVVKRLDMTLMPCLWVLYLFNYLDRASIASVDLESANENSFC